MKKLLLIMAMMMAGLALNAQNTPQEEDLDAKYGAELLKAGEQAPDFTLKDLDGSPIRLSDLKGKRIVLVFWASWCPDCRAEVPELKAMYTAADPAKVEFVSVSFDREFDTLQKFAADNALPGIQLFDPAGKKESKVGADYHIKWIPSLYLIDATGRIELGTVVAAKIAAALQGQQAAEIPGVPGKELCTDENCAL